MDDGYIAPKRTEYLLKCPLCGGEVHSVKSRSDPMGMRYKCKNPECEAGNTDASIDVRVSIYGCTVCGEDTESFSERDDHPYCAKHMPKPVKAAA